MGYHNTHKYNDSLTFQEYPNKLSNCICIVRFNGRRVGDIEQVYSVGGADYRGVKYRYVPKGQRKPGGIKGDLFNTVTDVKESLK